MPDAQQKRARKDKLIVMVNSCKVKCQDGQGVQNGQWLIESKVLYFSEVETIIITLCAKFFTAFTASKRQTLKKDHLRLLPEWVH